MNNRECTITECLEYHANCNLDVEDGCEVSLLDDSHNCGECSLNCGALQNVNDTSCINGQCVINDCDDGFIDCNDNIADGCEVLTTSYPTNCGRCGECGADVLPTSVLQAECITKVIVGKRVGSCVIVECAEGTEDCNENVEDGCETITSQINPECGPCGVYCNNPPPNPSPNPSDENNSSNNNNNTNVYENTPGNTETNNTTTNTTTPSNNGSNGGGNVGDSNDPPVDIISYNTLDQQIVEIPPKVNVLISQIGDPSTQVVFNNEVVVAYDPAALSTSSTSYQSTVSIVVETTTYDIPPPEGSDFISSVTSITIVDSGSGNATSGNEGSSVQLEQPIKICLVIDNPLDSKSENDACLAYADTSKNKWVCEDKCLSYHKSSDNGTTWACGKTVHFSFISLLRIIFIYLSYFTTGAFDGLYCSFWRNSEWRKMWRR